MDLKTIMLMMAIGSFIFGLFLAILKYNIINPQEVPVSDFVTASFGVTTVQYSPDISPEDIIATADKLLYKAKVSGRNRTEYAELKVDE